MWSFEPIMFKTSKRRKSDWSKHLAKWPTAFSGSTAAVQYQIYVENQGKEEKSLFPRRNIALVAFITKNQSMEHS